ncbi:MAG: SMC family ATPase [Nitrosopumilaceae archaeon]
MILNSILLENIRSYSRQQIEFPRGITLFEGDIGSGKSSVLMAIEFALFGLGSQNAQALLSKKANDGCVMLDFSVDGKNYQIKRSLKRRANSVNQDPRGSYLMIGDTKEPLSPAELKQRVLQILRFNEPASANAESRIFRYAVFTPQEEMKQVLSDSAKRLETIRRAFGVEDYRTAVFNAKEVASEIKLQMARFEERFGNISEYESIVDDARKKTLQLDSEISKLKKEKERLEEAQNSVEKKLEELRRKNQEKVQYETKYDSTKSNLEQNRKNLQSVLQEIKDTKKDLHDLADKLSQYTKITKPTSMTVAEIVTKIKKFRDISNELTKSRSESESLDYELAKLKTKLGKNVNSNKTKLEKNLKELKNELVNLEKTIDGNQKSVDLCNKEKIKNETICQRLEQDIANIAKLGSKCPICEGKITKTHIANLELERKEKLAEIDTKLKTITKEYYKTKSELDDQNSQKVKLEKQILELETIIPGIKEYEEKQARLSKIETKIKDFQKQNNVPKEDFEFETDDPVEYYLALKDRLVEYQNSKNQIEQIKENQTKGSKLLAKYEKEIDGIENEISSQEEKLSEIKKKIDSFAELDGEISQKDSELRKLRYEISIVSSRVAAANENLQNEKSKILENENKISDAKKWQVEYKKFRQYHSWLDEFFIPTIGLIEKQVLLSIFQSFNETYSRWYFILIEDPTKESQIDENFTPIVSQDGYEQDVSYLSGGEKTSIALAYRLTLNSLMRKETESMKSNLLILDEPTDGFSKTQLAKIRTLLDELKSEQIILVSHEKELETYVDNIFRISKDNGISQVLRLN